ncbi:hypothetical protein GGS23DRAFT_465969 [Durotheca rogersii]|uniref:uncharacterized protein n=1 Tax=Durotheca rogersii TaxID=419775 RepID=UPI00221EB840|nr:uncharacterized protein GGS23DRAFT_465969 [Durotheca rogersii]KAI5864836.1 hypothetical protein GGS23DRAFT_465969 [Durotheca rogersii]
MASNESPFAEAPSPPQPVPGALSDALSVQKSAHAETLITAARQPTGLASVIQSLLADSRKDLQASVQSHRNISGSQVSLDSENSNVESTPRAESPLTDPDSDIFNGSHSAKSFRDSKESPKGRMLKMKLNGSADASPAKDAISNPRSRQPQAAHLPADPAPVPETNVTTDVDDSSRAVAVVGMSCRLPGDSTTPEKLWELCAKGREAWSEWPESRFNQAAFCHPHPERAGTFNAKGGHFLTQGMGEFDTSFFNITPAEAKALDPQQRIQLENTYEALENAGIPLEKIAGSDTGVYIGTSNHDYAHMLWKDPDNLPLYHAVGTSAAIMANRISHFFDLRGPSVTIDTACSSTLVALHQACQGIRTGEITHAIVGGANLILEPGMLIPMSSLRFFSPEGRCYTYDHRAAGYGRGEGVGTVVLKNLKDAIRDGDAIRCVIRSTGVNSDGRTAGVMLPSGDAQETLIRSTYAAAGLDPALTRYVESHGTGTNAGDPIESGALGRVFGAASSRTGAPKVRVGSVKTNIGHLENASGIAGLIKTILSVEKGMILPNSNFEKPGERVLLEENHLEVPTTLEPWPVKGLRRASVCSFGFGGTNAHCVLDDAEHYLESHGVSGRLSQPLSTSTEPETATNGNTNGDVNGAEIVPTPRVFVISANDEHTCRLLSKTYASYFGSVANDSLAYADQLAYTLHSRRSLLPWRGAVVASNLRELSEKLASEELSLSRPGSPSRIGFVFTGQGAQWFGMGRELRHAYPVFKESMEAADRHLKTLGSPWSLMEQLFEDKDSSQLGTASVSQPACTAIQLAIVDLLSSWDVKPAAVIGHSSGEIAAAYAAGALTFESALAVAYYRGVAMVELKQVTPELRGGMLAAGISASEAQKLIMELNIGELTVACVNSPSSVTISGDVDAVEKLVTVLDERGIFARRLKVEVAYHSHHMFYASNGYLQNMLKGAQLPDGKSPSRDVVFASSLVAGIANLQDLTATYWVRNMVSSVRFSEALTVMVAGKQGSLVDTLLEIGPHSTLAGPIGQTLTSLSLKAKIKYLPTLVRNQNAHVSLLSTAAGLWTHDYPVDINSANRLEYPELKYGPLLDLPPYPFNHTVEHWHESRLSKDYRHRKIGRHDILGGLVPDSNSIEPRWRNILRLTENPWIKDHIVQSTVVFPAAGYIAMAIEAARQAHLMGARPLPPPKTFHLRRICLSTALVVPDSDAGVETSLSLRPVPDGDQESSTKWWEFRIFSHTVAAQSWSEHCRGQISIDAEADDHQDRETDDDGTAAFWKDRLSTEFQDCRIPLPSSQLYDIFNNMGLVFGATFRNLANVLVGANSNSTSEITIPDTKATMPYQAEFFNTIHPAVLDSCFQAAFPPVIYHGKLKDPMVPTFIEHLTIDANVSRNVGATFKAYASVQPSGLRNCLSDISVFRTDSSSGASPTILVKGLKTTSLTWSSTRPWELNTTRKICYTVPLETDVDLLDTTQLAGFWPAPDPSKKLETAESLAVLEWLAFQFMKEALAEIKPEDLEKMEWHHKRFYEWSLSQDVPSITTEPSNASLPVASGVLSLDDHSAKRSAAVSVAETLGAEGEVVLRVGKSLGPILKGEVDPLALMVEGGLLTEVYAQDRSMLRCYELLKTYVSSLSFKNPNLKILEIGAGTGGATEPFLQALGGGDTGVYPRFSKYTYTDISSAFFEKARARFSAWDGMLEYRTLDVERPPADQGFEYGTYDLIIAANVLHATRSMDVTMSNARRLLKPGGRLIMIEITNPRLRIFLPFGTLPGWWLGEGDGREMGPLLNTEMWDGVLRRNGYEGIEICEPDYPGPYQMSSLIVSRVPLENSGKPAPSVQIFSPGEDSGAVAELAKRLEKENQAPEVLSWSNLDKVTRGPLVIMDIEGNSLTTNFDTTRFSSIRKAFGSSHNILWVTSGANGSNPNAATVLGLSRSLRNEDAALKFVTLDLDSRTITNSSETAEKILRVLNSRLNGVANSEDQELIERDGFIKIPRLVEHKELNEELVRDLADVKKPPELEPLYQPKRPLRLQIGTPGLLDSLHFADVPDWEESLDADSVEVRIKAIGLNFRDVLTVLGQIENPYPLGFDSAGVVTAVGSNVKDFAIGDKVIVGLAVGSFTSVHRVNKWHLVHLPDGFSFEDGAAVPLPFVTAYHALVDVARVSKGQTVLIHSAAGGVGQAAVKLAQLAGAEVFVTVGSDEKRQFMIDEYGIPASHIFSSRRSGFAERIMRTTNGRGVDVVLNSLAGELLKETWDCIATFGYFLEIGKRDIYANTRLEMRPFDNHVTFAAIDLSRIFTQRLEWGSRIFNDCFQLFRDGKLTPMTPITAFPIDQAEAAFRFMQVGKHSGKIVVTVPEDAQVLVAPRENVRFLRTDATYLVAGGTGGLGREIARWMVDNGAHNILLLSRSGLDGNDKARELTDECAARGARVKVAKCDTRSTEDLSRVVREAREVDGMPPVRGVINGAMILRDSLFENMAFADWEAVTSTKLASTWNLHNEFLAAAVEPLDFFVLLSSASGISGNRGQSNYAASSAFQDAFARYRREALGLHASVLDLGMIESAGYVTDNADSVAYLRVHGYSAIKLKELFTMLRHAIVAGAGEREQVVSGYDSTAAEHVRAAASGVGSGAGIGLHDAKFSHLPQIHLAHAQNAGGEGGSGEGGSGAKVSLRQPLLSASGSERRDVLTQAVVLRLASLLGRDASDVSPTRSVAALGLDSLVAVELRNWIVSETGVGLPIFEILGAASLVELAGKIEAGCAFLE